MKLFIDKNNRNDKLEKMKNKKMCVYSYTHTMVCDNPFNKLDTLEQRQKYLQDSTETILSDLDIFNESDLARCMDILTKGKPLLVKTPFCHRKYELDGDTLYYSAVGKLFFRENLLDSSDPNFGDYLQRFVSEYVNGDCWKIKIVNRDSNTTVDEYKSNFNSDTNTWSTTNAELRTKMSNIDKKDLISLLDNNDISIRLSRDWQYHCIKYRLGYTDDFSIKQIYDDVDTDFVRWIIMSDINEDLTLFADIATYQELKVEILQDQWLSL